MESDERQARLRTVTEGLAHEEFTAAARSARAVVDGQGTLLDLSISNEMLRVRALDLDALNADILAAVSGARRQAAEHACRALHPVFPALFPDGEG